MIQSKKTALLTSLALWVLALTGCAGLEPVQAWEKGDLARPQMAFEGDKLEAGYAEHIYSSKQGASGGSAVGGGGCGCN